MPRHLTRQDMIDLGYIPTFNHMSMKLKHFNPETLIPPKNSPDLHMVLRKSGAITFTTSTCKAFDLKLGSRLELLQDEESKSWYLVKSKKGFEIRNIGQQLGFSSAQLVNVLWPNRKEDEKSVHLIIQPDPIHYKDGEATIDLHLITFSKS